MRGLKEAGRGQDNSLGYDDWLVAFFVQRCKLLGSQRRLYRPGA